MSPHTERRLIPTSAHWGTYLAEVEEGKLVAVQDYAEDSAPAIIGLGIVDAIDDAVRVRRPMIRKGWLEAGPKSREKRGRDPYVAVPWAEALDMAAAELARIADTYGNEAIFGGSYGWAVRAAFITRKASCTGF